jgi:hypothetical protein
MAQSVVKDFYEDSLSAKSLQHLKDNFSYKKTLPLGFESQSLIALSYFPELKNIKIIFKVQNRKTPLSTKPSIVSLFKNAKRRTYIITISKKSNSFLDTITLHNLNYNAQIGVLGHELSHVCDFSNKNIIELTKIFFGHLSSKFINKFEFNTDRICINHMLGNQLLAWSINVRRNLKIINWSGASGNPKINNKERYMNPTTIINILKTQSLYIKK